MSSAIQPRRFHPLPLLACLLLAACASTPLPPAGARITAPAQYLEGGPWQPGSGAPSVPDAWWTLFQDPVLDDLERRVLVGNENLKSAVAQLAVARASLDASRSAKYPSLAAGLSGNRASSAQTAVTGPVNSASLTANSTWEVDLWGRLRQASEGAQSLVQASADDLAAATLSTQASVAQTYFAMRTAEAQAALLARSVQAFEKALALTHTRYLGGVASLSDELQAQTQLDSTRSQWADALAQRSQLAHALAVLLGQTPSEFTLAPTAHLPAPVAVPASLPSTLLERRPDIAAAQARVNAAYAQIGVAHAAYFPALNLNGSAGYNQNSLANLVSAPNLAWSLGASLVQNIFDGGQRALANTQAKSQAEQATAAYRQQVLTALQEVEDNLALAHALGQELAWQTRALASAQRNLEITQAQYQAGTVGYLNVVSAQSSALGAESALYSTRNRQLAAINLLLKNMAGRWTPA